jgi:hypothetical protein
MQNKPTYTFDGEVGTVQLAVDALIPFWRIKAATERRTKNPTRTSRNQKG